MNPKESLNVKSATSITVVPLQQNSKFLPSSGYKEQGSIPEPELPRRREKAGKSLHLMAWNVGGLRAFLKSRIPDLQEAIKDAKPHVFGIMEHKLTDNVAAKIVLIFKTGEWAWDG